ncbi:MAG: hypothetical protein H6703_15315 [Myxococcales bacterium]|nr:hypothetical protein [Myxococcales bacterium]
MSGRLVRGRGALLGRRGGGAQRLDRRGVVGVERVEAATQRGREAGLGAEAAVQVAAQGVDLFAHRRRGLGGGDGGGLQALEGVDEIGAAGERAGVVEAGGLVFVFVGAEEVTEQTLADHAAGGALGARGRDRREREPPGCHAHAGDVGLVEQVAAPERAFEAVDGLAERRRARPAPSFTRGPQRRERVVPLGRRDPDPVERPRASVLGHPSSSRVAVAGVPARVQWSLAQRPGRRTPAVRWIAGDFAARCDQTSRPRPSSSGRAPIAETISRWGMMLVRKPCS